MHVIDSKSKLYSFEVYDEIIESKSPYDLLQSLIEWRFLTKTKNYIKKSIIMNITQRSL